MTRHDLPRTVRRRPIRAAVATVACTALVLGACSGDADDVSAPVRGDDPTSTTSAATDDESVDAQTPEALDASADAHCPGDYADEGGAPTAGLNEGFEAGGQTRAFHLLEPDDSFDGPRPLMVALTGTVQTEEGFVAQSGMDQLTDDGWFVVAPVRNANGLLWGPWDAMRTPDQDDLPNPDVTFLDELVWCLGAHHDVDASRIFVSGISIGATMVNYLLQRSSELYAGGIVGSGNFITTGPVEPEPLDDMVVIVAWGGDDDQWAGCMDGRMGAEAGASGDPGCIPGISFVNDAALASQFFDAAPEVAQVACSMDVGHRWITEATDYFAEVLLAHPKGSGPQVTLPAGAPDGLTCTTEAFVLDES